MISLLALAAATATTTAIEAFTNGALLAATLYTAAHTGKVVRHRVKK